jgi:hypothetical protein
LLLEKSYCWGNKKKYFEARIIASMKLPLCRTIMLHIGHFL